MEIRGYRAEIIDDYTKLRSNIVSNRNEALNEIYHYINKYNKELLEKPRFRKDYSMLESIQRDYNRQLNEKINEYVEKLRNEQEEEIKKVLDDLFDRFETLTVENINTIIYNAKNNIMGITRDKLNAIDGFVEDYANDVLNQYSNDCKEKLPSQDISSLVRNYREGVANNIYSVKNKFADTTRSEIELFYDYTCDKLKDIKKGKESESLEEKTLPSITDNELITELAVKEEKANNKVKVSDIGLDFISIGTLEKFMNTVENVSLSEVDGYLVAKDPNGNEHDVSLKEENGKKFLRFHGYNEFLPIGVDLDFEDKSLCVKKGDLGVAFNSETNEIQASTKENKYTFEFENGNTKVFYYENGEKKEVSEEESVKIVEELISKGIEITNVLNYAIENSKNIEGEAKEQMEEISRGGSLQ